VVLYLLSRQDVLLLLRPLLWLRPLLLLLLPPLLVTRFCVSCFLVDGAMHKSKSHHHHPLLPQSELHSLSYYMAAGDEVPPGRFVCALLYQRQLARPGAA
jgi:hypothetical protein